MIVFLFDKGMGYSNILFLDLFILSQSFIMETKHQRKSFGLGQKIRNFMCAEGTHGEAPLLARDVIKEKRNEIEAVRISIEGKKTNEENGSVYEGDRS